MTYLLGLVYLALIYVRPGEIIPGLIGFPFLEITTGAAALAAVISLALKPRGFMNLPNDWCFLGFCGAAVLSVPANGWLGGGYRALLLLLPLITFYVLTRLAVTTARQLRWFAVVLVALTAFQAGNGILQYYTGTGLGGSTAHVKIEADAESETGVEETKRIRGTGIFGDPNDLAMSLVIVLPFLFGVILSRSSVLGWLSSVAVLGIVMLALVLTQSRGGLVGVGAASAAFAYRRFGKGFAAAIGVVVFAALLALGPSRFQNLETSESSAQGRIQAWAAGLAMFKSAPVLGVGYGNYAEYNELVAHNSFVHAFAETGFVGGYFLVGLCYWFLVGNGAGRNVAGAAGSRLARDIWASGIGAMTCALFLSRQYSPVFYVPLVMGAARIAVEKTEDGPAPTGKWSEWVLIVFLSVGVIVSAYIAVRSLAVWSRG